MTDAANEVPRFVTGGKPGPGRPKGSKNRLCEDFLGDMHEAWQTSGKSAIAAMIEKDPGGFVKTVAGLVPKEMALTINDHSEMSDAELAERIRVLAAQLAPFIADGTGAVAEGGEGTDSAQLASRVH